jgi:ABC-2 type transport system ATP-binding protein
VVDARDRAALGLALQVAGYGDITPCEAGGVRLDDARAVAAPDEVARMLVAAGTPPTRLAVEQEDLEQHFLRLTGETV